MKNPKGANIVMMGAMAANSDLFTEDDLERLTNEFFGEEGQDQPEKQPLLPRRHADPLNRRTPRGFAHESASARQRPGKIPLWRCKFLNVLDVIIILAYFVGMIVLGLIANKKTDRRG